MKKSQNIIYESILKTFSSKQVKKIFFTTDIVIDQLEIINNSPSLIKINKKQLEKEYHIENIEFNNALEQINKLLPQNAKVIRIDEDVINKLNKTLKLADKYHGEGHYEKIVFGESDYISGGVFKPAKIDPEKDVCPFLDATEVNLDINIAMRDLKKYIVLKFNNNTKINLIECLREIKYTLQKDNNYTFSKNEFIFKKNGDLFLGKEKITNFEPETQYYKILSLFFYDIDFSNKYKIEDYISNEDFIGKIPNNINITNCINQINTRVYKKYKQYLIEKLNCPKRNGNKYKLNKFLKTV